jgi:hypothetical protein
MMNYPGTVGRGHRRPHPRRQIIFLVTPEQEQRIKDAARERGVTRANLIREGLEMVLTLGRDGSPDLGPASPRLTTCQFSSERFDQFL